MKDKLWNSFCVRHHTTLGIDLSVISKRHNSPKHHSPRSHGCSLQAYPRLISSLSRFLSDIALELARLLHYRVLAARILPTSSSQSHHPFRRVGVSTNCIPKISHGARRQKVACVANGSVHCGVMNCIRNGAPRAPVAQMIWSPCCLSHCHQH